MKKDVFGANKIMKIMGQQVYWQYVNNDFMGVLNALKAAGEMNMFTIALNFYTLGIMTGKRLERAERNRKEYEPITKE